MEKTKLTVQRKKRKYALQVKTSSSAPPPELWQILIIKITVVEAKSWREGLYLSTLSQFHSIGLPRKR